MCQLETCHAGPPCSDAASPTDIPGGLSTVLQYALLFATRGKSSWSLSEGGYGPPGPPWLAPPARAASP
eukprot:4910741-Alexandrium_andersonii.AAC.1